MFLNNVDKILSYFQKLINKLAKVEEQQRKDAEHEGQIARDAEKRRKWHNDEAERASRIRKNLENLTQ